MAGRSLKATPHGLTIAINALTGLGISKEDFAAKVEIQGNQTTQGIGIATAKKFFTGKSVDRKYFVAICQALGLNWEEVEGLQAATVAETVPNPKSDINHLVQTIRAQVHADIQDRCGKMRVLDMEQPISLGDIYTSVNILEKLSRNQRLPREEWLKHDPENFDRFLLGQVHQERVPGLEVVERYDKLMILGKPGAGKTTFMKRLAILCNQAEFQPRRVPVFVTLKDYAEATGKPTLPTYIQRQWNACGVKSADAISTVLGDGKALVLLDGLDEVYETDHDRVLQDIKTFAHQFRTCQCVITCRIAAREYTFEQFTEVEVADFDQDQIAEFATKWFATKQDPQKAEIFIRELNNENNKPIRELAVTPILLTLLCLIFEETSEFPKNRSEFYREGTDWLLKRWDEKRYVKRDLVYKKISLLHKKELLSQLAFETFERGAYFFKKDTVEKHIIRYISNLLRASNDEEVLQLDGEAVLKSIEAQHGLLVERARGIYSFSHLTFQEYFTAQRYISPTAALNQTLQNLAIHITEKRYREIFLLAAGMLPEADTLLLLMKRQIDQSMMENPTESPKLQTFLAWTEQKVASTQASYKPAAIRAFYYDLVRTLTRDLAPDLARTLTRDLDRALALDLALANARTLALAFDRALAFNRSRAPAPALAPALTRALALDPDLDLAERAAAIDPELRLKIQALRAELPNRDNREAFEQWWLTNGQAWAERLRTMMIEHRKIGHDWQFNNTQKDKLRQYYNANKLLVDCLNSDCYVTKATRQYIEDTLLLPLSEIEKYPVPDAIANL